MLAHSALSGMTISYVGPVSGWKCHGMQADKSLCCTADTPCADGGGDCEGDDGCAGELVCGWGNCKRLGVVIYTAS